MLVHCTKKLLSELNIKPELVQEPDTHAKEDHLFSWHANLIKIDEGKLVVLVNDKNRYVSVLYWPRTEAATAAIDFGEFEGFDEIILQAIRYVFREECIKEEVIEKFLEYCGEVSFTKTGSRSLVARLNHACETVQFYSNLLDNSTIFQGDLSKKASGELVSMGKQSDYFHPNKEMYKELEAISGKDIFSCRALVLKVTLDLGERSVWRRIVIPANMSFYKLHDALQAAFSWQDCHLHEFHIYDGDEHIVNLVSNEEAFEYLVEGMEMKHEKGIRLSDYLFDYQKLVYVYDLGDNWEHHIEVEKVIDDYNANYPVCFDGEGNAPPEDVGGTAGYEEFLEIIADENHPEHKNMVQWSRMQGYEDFDIKKVNRVMTYKTR